MAIPPLEGITGISPLGPQLLAIRAASMLENALAIDDPAARAPAVQEAAATAAVASALAATTKERS